MEFTLRDYQIRDVNRVRAALADGHRAVLLVSPTGSGKTVLMAWMASRAADRGKRTLFCVHRQELMHQASETFEAMGVAHGLIAPGRTMTRDAIQIASVQTLVRRFDSAPAPDLVILDEAHHAASATWRRIFEAYPNARFIGLTATPARLDGRGLDDLFDDMVCGPTVIQLIEQGWLSPYRAFAPPIGIDLAAVNSRAGDFARGELAEAVDKPTITGDACRHYMRLAPGKQAIAFCVSVEHSRHVEAQFRSLGIAAQHIDGAENRHRRRDIFKRFAAGGITVLTNCDLVSEGLDVPAVEAAILLRPTQSLVLYLQQVGRALRPQPGKTAIILDHAGNIARHGLPDDDRQWMLAGRAKGERRKTEPDIAVAQCPKCFACHAPAPRCPACGHVYESHAREIDAVDGALEEVDVEVFRAQRRRAQGRAQSLAELEAIARERGYNPGWAWRVWNSRQRRAGRAA